MIRQQEAEELSKQCDRMIVIGDRKSRNTNKLCDVASRHCKNVVLAESADGIKNLALSGITGVTAGASAPDWIIKEVLKTMEENKTNTELSFAEEFEKSLTTLNTGDVVKGTVISITPTEVRRLSKRKRMLRVKSSRLFRAALSLLLTAAEFSSPHRRQMTDILQISAFW